MHIFGKSLFVDCLDKIRGSMGTHYVFYDWVIPRLRLRWLLLISLFGFPRLYLVSICDQSRLSMVIKGLLWHNLLPLSLRIVYANLSVVIRVIPTLDLPLFANDERFRHLKVERYRHSIRIFRFFLLIESWTWVVVKMAIFMNVTIFFRVQFYLSRRLGVLHIVILIRIAFNLEAFLTPHVV